MGRRAFTENWPGTTLSSSSWRGVLVKELDAQPCGGQRGDDVAQGVGPPVVDRAGDGALAVRVRPLVLVAAGATDEVPPLAEPLRLQRDVDGVPVRQVDESQCRRLAAICSARVTGRTGTTGRRAPGPQAGVPPLARARYSSRRRRL